MIVVMGAAGHTGKATAEKLLSRGQKIRVIGRSAARLQALTDRGAESAVGDVFDGAFLARAFSGAEGVYAMVPPDYSQADLRVYYNRCADVMTEAARKAGVKRIVLLSSLGAEHESGTGPIAGLHDVEKKLERVGEDLLILRPGYFYDNLYASIPIIKSQGINGGAIEPDVPIPMTATTEIGAAAGEELAEGKFTGTSIRELLGPRDYTMSEATRVLGAAIGKPDLPYLRFPDADFEKALLAAGFSKGAASALVEMSHALSAGRVRSLQGRTPRTTVPDSLESFAKTFAAAYRAG